MRAASARGWRCCALTRRGHGGLGLRTARFSVHGSVEDTRIMVEEVRRDYPDVFIGKSPSSLKTSLTYTQI